MNEIQQRREMHVIRRSNRIDHSWDLYARVAYRASVDISTLLNDKLCSFRVKRVVFLSSIRNDSRLIRSPRKSRESWRSGGQDLRDLVKDTHSQFRIFETRGGVAGQFDVVAQFLIKRKSLTPAVRSLVS